MKAVFPGKPQAKLHALCTALWEGQRLVVYISNNTLIILNGPTHLLQTISHAESEHLEAVAISESSGKIAVCTTTTVFVYRPVGHGAEDLRWALQHTLTPSSADSSIACLSWGLPDEVLASGSYLTLFHTDSPAHEVWSRKLANPAKYAIFTPDASFVASTGWHDRLVKVWQRVVLNEDDERVDISYLSHPSAVTALRWHRRPDQEHHADTVLYTACADSKLRIWAATDHHALQPLQLWTEFDLTECILPRTPLSPISAASSSQRYIFIVDGWEFETMIEQAIRCQNGGDRERHTREHLLDVAYRNPDICVVMDQQGNMSAWGLERVGCKARQPNDIFNILLAEQVNLPLPDPNAPLQDFLCLLNFAGSGDGTLNLITNLFDGAIHWLSSSVDQFFDTASNSRRFDVDAIWTGPSEPIQSLIASSSCKRVLSVGSHHELILWAQDDQISKSALVRKGTCRTAKPISIACLCSNDQYAVVVQQDLVSLWDLQSLNFEELSTCAINISTEISCLTPLHSLNQDSSELFAIISNEMEGSILRVTPATADDQASVEVFPVLKFDKTAYPSGITQKFRAIKALDSNDDSTSVLYSLDSSGDLIFWSFDIDMQKMNCKVIPTAQLKTQIKDASRYFLGTNGKAAVVSKTKNDLSIWDVNLQHLEYVEHFKSFETIESLDMMLANGDQTLLAAAFLHKANIYAQNRYSFNHEDQSWILLRTVDISLQTSVPISDCLWLSTHDLLLSAGNQMFLFDGAASIPDPVISSIDPPAQVTANQPLANIVGALNAVPAVFTPQLNAQMLASGKLELVDYVFNKLRTKLKFWSPGDELESNLGLGIFECLKLETTSVNKSISSSEQDEASDESVVFSEDSAAALNETLNALDLPFLSTSQQVLLGNLGESIAFFEKQRGSVDNLGIRYLVNLHHHTNANQASSSQIGFREISWAFHSNSQDILIDLTSRICGGKMLWTHARQSGMFLWIQDLETVRAQFEVIARNEYTKTDERNPIDCSLYYLALKKKQVLEGLWRLATWHREQKLTRRLLSNNFNEPRWKTAAMKNAYALLGFRRFEYAAAFFLLADRLKDAVTVLANQLNDVQLAIAVARVYEGDDGPVLRELLEETVLPNAALEGDKWLSSWAYWMLQQKEKALRALTEPLENLIKLPKIPPIESKHYRKHEPALAHHFSLLRDRCRQTPRQTVSVHPKAEWDLVMRSAISYVRAGCHILALDLVRNWKFTDRTMPKQINNTEVTQSSGVSEVAQEAQLVDGLWGQSLGGRGEMDVDTTANKMNGTAFAERKKVTEEPSAASILDNFNF